MATLTGNILEGTTGRLGQVVIYRRMGTWCVRRHVEHIRDAKSEAQLRCRSRFAAMIRTASHMADALATGLRSTARAMGMLDSNLFLRLNNGCFSSTDDGGCAVDYRGLQLSAGPVAPVRFTSARIEDGLFDGRFERLGGAGRSNATDRVQVYVYCPDLECGVLSLPVYRMDRRVRFVLPDTMQGREVHCYAFCTASDDFELASPTCHIAVGEADTDDTDATATPDASRVGNATATAGSATVSDTAASAAAGRPAGDEPTGGGGTGQ